MYFWTSMQIAISLVMTVVFGYVYFSLFLAFFIGNIRSRAGFYTLYTIQLVSAIATINYGFVTKNTLIVTQFPFVLISLIAVILLPLNTYNRNKREELQDQLEDANKRISDLVKLEERQRIARDLHDTLGQKLSLIGLKSDLAGKLMRSHPDQAQVELDELRQTSRSALKEVREMVTSMRGMRLEDEMFRVQQILKAAQIEFILEGDPKLTNVSLLNDNVLGMCLKEAVTNVVKHSNATLCSVNIEATRADLVVTIKDDGIGLNSNGYIRGNGLRGMKERLEFVNGNLDIKFGPRHDNYHKGTECCQTAPGGGQSMIRIVIAEDQRMLLGALASLLNLEPDMDIIGKASNGEEAIELVHRLKPDICLMDIEMPIKSGLEAAEELKKSDCKIIILTTFARSGYFERALKGGVRGYLLKDSPIEELADSIRNVMKGRRIFATELVDDAYGEENPLTEREQKVLGLIADGKNTKEIAGELYITTGTVRNYISVILDKLNVSNRIEAIMRFKEKGWFK